MNQCNMGENINIHNKSTGSAKVMLTDWIAGHTFALTLSNALKCSTICKANTLVDAASARVSTVSNNLTLQGSQQVP